MSDASDLAYHIEEGLLHFVRGGLVEARQSWRKVLLLEPGQPEALDYIKSTDAELTAQERSREAELLKAARQAARASGLPWEDDDFEMIAAGPADDDEDVATGNSIDTVSITGFLVEEEDGGGIETGDDVAEADGPMAAARSRSNGWIVSGDESAGQGAARAASGAPAGRPVREGEVWEPLDWVNEITPAVPVADMDSLRENLERGSSERSRAAEAASAAASGVPSPSRAGAGVGSRGAGKAGSSSPGSGASTEASQSKSGHRKGNRAAVEPPPPPVELSPDELLEQARHHLREDQPELARQALLRLLDKNPAYPGALEALETAISSLLSAYQDVLGDGDGVPELNPKSTDLYSLKLDEVGGYILSRIDGIVSLDDLYTVSAHLDRLDVMRILVELVQADAIRIRND